MGNAFLGRIPSNDLQPAGELFKGCEAEVLVPDDVVLTEHIHRGVYPPHTVLVVYSSTGGLAIFLETGS